MPTYVIDGKRYNSPTPLSEDDLLELSGGSKAPAPTGEQPSTLQKIGRTADDLVRAAANGVTFGWADRLAAGANAATGNGDYASNVKQERQLSADAQKRNPYVYKGVEIGSGLVLPGVGLVKGASTGAQVANAAGNGALFGALGGAGMESGDTDPLKALTNAGVGAGTGAAIGAVATPLVNKGLEYASRFSPKVDTALTQGAVARNYKNNPNANVDAEITRDLGLMAGGKDKGLQAIELNDLAKSYINQAKQEAQNAGVLGDLENLNITNFRSILARPQDVEKLQSTPTGQAILDVLNKAKRTAELTQASEANNGAIPKLGRTLVDSGILDAAIMGTTGIPVPIATAARQGIKKAMGANSTRAEVAAGLTTPRGIKAAEQFLETAGPSEATKGMGILKQASDDVLAGAMGSQRAQLATDRLDSQRVFERTGIPGGGGNQAVFTKNPRLAEMPKGSYMAELQKIASDPTFSNEMRMDAAKLMRGENTNTESEAFYSIQNLLADRLEKGVFGKGILDQVKNPGKLYEGQNVTVEGIRKPSSYNANVRNAEEAAKIARDSAFSPELGQFATTVAGIKAPADKLAAVQERLAKATDPAEIDYINKFVLPLANFGKK